MNRFTREKIVEVFHFKYVEIKHCLTLKNSLASS